VQNTCTGYARAKFFRRIEAVHAGLLSTLGPQNCALHLADVWIISNAVLCLIFLGIQLLMVSLAFGGRLSAIMWVALMYGPILWVSLLVHAMGSAFGARSVGGDCDEVIFWPLGVFLNVYHSAGAHLASSPTGPSLEDLWTDLHIHVQAHDCHTMSC
jgi:hypothetical protein